MLSVIQHMGHQPAANSEEAVGLDRRLLVAGCKREISSRWMVVSAPVSTGRLGHQRFLAMFVSAELRPAKPVATLDSLRNDDIRRRLDGALTEMNLQLHHVVADITAATGMRIIRAILAGERNPKVLAHLRDYRCHSSAEKIEKALTGSYRAEHLFALDQALALFDAYHEKVSACDVRIEAVLKELSISRSRGSGSLPSSRRRTDQTNAMAFDVRAALFALLGKDVTQINGLGPYLSLKLIAECGDDLSAWPSAKHFTSWLCLAPSNKISGGKVLSSRTRRSGSRASALLRLAAVTVGRTDTALGAFYRRLSARIGKAKAVTATARKIAVLFYNAVRHGMEYVDPGASFYETRYRKRVVENLHRRAKAFGFVLHPAEPTPSVAVS